MWLPDGEKISKISLLVLTECTNVTDGQTDTAGRHRSRLRIASRGNYAKAIQRKCLNMNRNKQFDGRMLLGVHGPVTSKHHSAGRLRACSHVSARQVQSQLVQPLQTAHRFVFHLHPASFTRGVI